MGKPNRPSHHRKHTKIKTYKGAWLRSLEKLGLTYEIHILETLETHEECIRAEIWWIAYGRACGWPLTNMTDGGEGGFNRVFTSEHRMKISLAKMGNTGGSGTAGLVRSKQNREKIRQQMIGNQNRRGTVTHCHACGTVGHTSRSAKCPARER